MVPPSRPSRTTARRQPSITQDPSITPPIQRSGATPAPNSHRWTFLTNHSHVLILLHKQPEIVMREVAQQVGITERAVQRIVLDLVEGGFLKREKIGRHNRYRIITDQRLRHPIESHRRIGDLLGLITTDDNPSSPNRSRSNAVAKSRKA